MNNKIELIPINLIKADPSQPRQEFELGAMKRLENSIGKLGILNPLSLEKVNGTYLIIDGERRFRAATKLKLKELPAFISDKSTEQERLVKRFHLQEQHSGWSSLDKATAVFAIYNTLNLTVSETAKMLGLSETTINGYIMSMNLSKRTFDFLARKKLPLDYLREIVMVCKKVENKVLRKKVEESLVKKIENGTIEKAKEMRIYGKSLNHIRENQELKDKIINKIISSKTFSAQDAMDASDFGGVDKIKQITGSARWILSKVRQAVERNYGKYLGQADVNDLEKLIKKLKSFINSAGYVLPKE